MSGSTRGELAVVDLEVVVHQGRAARLGEVPGEQLADPVQGAAAVERDGLPASLPAANLPLQVARGTAEVAQAALRRVDQMEVRERVHHGQPDATAGVLTDLQQLGDVVPDDDARAVLRDQEVRADHRLVGAVVESERRSRVRRVQERQHVVLAAHVVCRRGDHAERRPAYDEVGLAEPDEVGEVRRAVGELQDREVPDRLWQVLPQVGLEGRPVELLPGTDLGDLRPSLAAPRRARSCPAPASSTGCGGVAEGLRARDEPAGPGDVPVRPGLPPRPGPLLGRGQPLVGGLSARRWHRRSTSPRGCPAGSPGSRCARRC